jgi:hypothetical protein
LKEISEQEAYTTVPNPRSSVWIVAEQAFLALSPAGDHGLKEIFNHLGARGTFFHL